MRLLIMLSFVFCNQMVIANTKVKLKIAALAPEGTSWAQNIKDFAIEVGKKTEGRVEIRSYLGGIAGDEPDILRKIRVGGQMHGGVFTGKILGEIYSDVRVMELPFNFYHDQGMTRKVLTQMTPEFNKGFLDNGFVNLGFYEVGQVYVVSTKPVKNLEGMKGIKVWSWEGDKLVEAMINELQLVSVPLALPDVLSSLTTGIIDSAYAPPLGILALQWQSKVKYMVDFPIAFSIGAFLIKKDIWEKIDLKDRELIQKISQEFVAKANETSARENQEGLAALKNMGVEFIQFPKTDTEKAESIRTKVIQRVREKSLSANVIDTFEKIRTRKP
jgi:TRAP-type C4-dicarboxylate transport system substrate-binding protein